MDVAFCFQQQDFCNQRVERPVWFWQVLNEVLLSKVFSTAEGYIHIGTCAL